MPYVQTQISREERFGLLLLAARTGKSVKTLVRTFVQEGLKNHLTEEELSWQKKTTTQKKANAPES